MIALLKKFVNDTIGTTNSMPLTKLIGVKSIQRGIGNSINTSTAIWSSVTITISNVNIKKCQININGFYDSISGSYTTFYFTLPILYSATDTSLIITSAMNPTNTHVSVADRVGRTFSWEVIEYY